MDIKASKSWKWGGGQKQFSMQHCCHVTRYLPAGCQHALPWWFHTPILWFLLHTRGRHNSSLKSGLFQKAACVVGARFEVGASAQLQTALSSGAQPIPATMLLVFHFLHQRQYQIPVMWNHDSLHFMRVYYVLNTCASSFLFLRSIGNCVSSAAYLSRSFSWNDGAHLQDIAAWRFKECCGLIQNHAGRHFHLI